MKECLVRDCKCRGGREDDDRGGTGGENEEGADQMKAVAQLDREILRVSLKHLNVCRRRVW